LICPAGFDVFFLKKFSEVIGKYIKKDCKFVIICGGGSLARTFQATASQYSKLSDEYLDWLGIHATKINARLVKSIFGSNAEDFIISNPSQKIKFKKSIVIGAGWKPGHSTDFDAVLWAKQFGAHEVINLSNIDYVYDKDPREHKDAKPIPAFTWKEFLSKFGGAWSPRMHKPFDPIASKEAAKLKLKVIIANGADLGNVEKILNNEKFIGTVIR